MNEELKVTHIYLVDTKLLCYYLFQRGSSLLGMFDKIAEFLYNRPKGKIYLGWDIGKSSYRLGISSSYKGNRNAAKQRLQQHELDALNKFNEDYIKLSEIADMLPVINLKVPNLECDDMCSMVAKTFENNPRFYVHLVTADKDWLHSVVGTNNVELLNVYNSDEVIKHSDVVKMYNLDTRRKFTILKSIVGDKSDNIKFCNNLGEVKAKEVFDMIYERYSNPSDDEIIDVIEGYLKAKEEHRIKRKLKLSITVHEDHIKDGRTTPREAFLANMLIADPFTNINRLTDEQKRLFLACIDRELPKEVDFNTIFNKCLDETGQAITFGYKAAKIFRVT